MATLVGAVPAPPGRVAAALTDFRVRAALAAGCVWVVLYAILTALAESNTAQNFVSDVVYIVPVAFATSLSFAAAARTRGRRRLFWSILAASNLLWFAGEATWSAYELVLRRESPFPSVADLFYLSSYALVPVAILGGFASGSFRGALRRLVDSSVMVAAVGLVAWSLLIGPQLDWGLSLATATGIAYPLFGVAILMLVGSVGLRGLRRAPFSIALVAAAFAISALTDAAYTYLAVVHDYVDGRWLNVGWQAEAVLLSVAALAAFGNEAEPANDDRRDHGLLLVLIGGIASVSIVAVDSYNGNLSTASLTLGAYATGAVLVRLYLTSRENNRLAHKVESSLAAEENLVKTLRERNERLAEQASVLEETLAERERGEQDRRALEERLRQSQKLDTFGKLAGGVSHEFETMLTTMTRSADSLVTSLEGPALEDAERIKVAADRAAAMMQQLLAFGRQQILRPELVDLNDFVEETAALLRPLLRQDIRIESGVASDSCDVDVDAAQLEQLVVNLALNAQDAMPEGGVLTISASSADLHSDSSRWGLDLPRGRYACLTVADDGSGMDDVTRARIFEPFFSTKAAGLGLGLATVHGIVRQSGGDVRVESRPGSGARFEMFLPFA
jgi:signal transduction histidine kinase